MTTDILDIVVRVVLAITCLLIWPLVIKLFFVEWNALGQKEPEEIHVLHKNVDTNGLNHVKPTRRPVVLPSYAGVDSKELAKEIKNEVERIAAGRHSG